MKIGFARRRAQTAMVNLPVVIGRSPGGERPIRGFDRLKRNDFAPVPAGSQIFTELANIGSDIDYNVDPAIFNEIDQVPNSPSAEVKDAETLVDGPDCAIHLSVPFLPFSGLFPADALTAK
jgi:hypothetical protein